MNKNGQRQPPFQVGDRVRFPIGRGKELGIVVEWLGAFGPDRHHLFRVQAFSDPDDAEIIALPEEVLEPAGPKEAEPVPDKASRIAYLSRSGLVAILRSNLKGGKDQPRVWLCFNSLGDVTHTFYEDRGGVGGQTVPSGAIRGYRVFTPKKEQVLCFLESFGLTRKEAEDVVRAVGTAS